jgi:hypothetical protein
MRPHHQPAPAAPTAPAPAPALALAPVAKEAGVSVRREQGLQSKQLGPVATLPAHASTNIMKKIDYTKHMPALTPHSEAMDVLLLHDLISKGQVVEAKKIYDHYSKIMQKEYKLFNLRLTNADMLVRTSRGMEDIKKRLQALMADHVITAHGQGRGDGEEERSVGEAACRSEQRHSRRLQGRQA